MIGPYFTKRSEIARTIRVTSGSVAPCSWKSAAILGITNVSKAADSTIIVSSAVPGELGLKPIKGLRFVLKIEHIDQIALIEIKDNNGTLYHSEYVSKNQTFAKVYDLSNLPDGEFFFKVTDGKQVLRNSFIIETETKRNLAGL